ncbi:MAG: hypothetical protein JWM68_3760 [Verrucomicrobiales bacterium]|nr:hypothetical protein [Verrucomicrobiales bacterium]
MKAIPIQTATKLEQLAKEIRSLHDNTERLSVFAKSKCNEAVAEAILCGKAINEAKKLVGHGQFAKWLKKNCPKISDRTARRYMALANRSHVSVLKRNGLSLRQAYIEAGIINEKEVLEFPELPDKPQEAVTPAPKPYVAPVTPKLAAVVTAKPVRQEVSGPAVRATLPPRAKVEADTTPSKHPAIIIIGSRIDDIEKIMQSLPEDQKADAIKQIQRLEKWI